MTAYPFYQAVRHERLKKEVRPLLRYIQLFLYLSDTERPGLKEI